MKLYLVDELYDYVKDRPDFKEIYNTISQKYYAESIEYELSAFYNLRNRTDVMDYFDKVSNEIKTSNPDLYKIIYYKSNDLSFDTLVNLYKFSESDKERLLLLERILSFGLNDGVYYKYIKQFSNIYVAYQNKTELPKYIHLTYYEIYPYFTYYDLKDKNHKFVIDDYKAFIDEFELVKSSMSKFITSTDTLENDYMEIQATYLNLIENDLSVADMAEIASNIKIDADKLPFDNKQYSAGVIWLYEEIMECYLNNKDYVNFFLSLFKLFSYVDNALQNLTLFFDALRYYNKFNIYSVASSIVRLLFLKNMFSSDLSNYLILNNLKDSDETYLQSKDFIEKIKFNYTNNKNTLNKYYKYIETWINTNTKELESISNNTAVMEDAKATIKEYIATLGGE